MNINSQSLVATITIKTTNGIKHTFCKFRDGTIFWESLDSTNIQFKYGTVIKMIKAKIGLPFIFVIKASDEKLYLIITEKVETYITQ